MRKAKWIGVVGVALWALLSAVGCVGQGESADDEAEAVGSAEQKLCDGPSAQGGFQLLDMSRATKPSVKEKAR